jgi:uncharacterized membrane protein YfcA
MDGPRRRRSQAAALPAKGGTLPPELSVTAFYALLSSLVADPRFPAALAVACISGVVRGFSGFGSALIYVPLMAAIYEPRIAAVTLLITDSVASMPFAIGEVRRCNWREVAPLSIAAIATIPLGVLALQYFEPVTLRWGIAILVVGLLAVMVSGWRYHVEPSIPVSVGVGLIAGIGAGAVQISGPAAIIYWLGGPNKAATIRANLMVYFGLLAIASFVIYYLRGLFTADVLVLSLLLGPVFIVSMAGGAYLFRGSSEHSYRRVAYAIIALSALVSLPLFDELFR